MAPANPRLCLGVPVVSAQRLQPSGPLLLGFGQPVEGQLRALLEPVLTGNGTAALSHVVGWLGFLIIIKENESRVAN